MATVLIADHHHLFRRGFAMLVQSALLEGAEIVEADSYADACGALTLAQGTIDLVICGLNMPDADPFASLKRIVSLAHAKPVVATADRGNLDDARRCLECGAKAYVPKAERAHQLRMALEMVLRGGTYVPARILLDQAPRIGCDKTDSDTAAATPAVGTEEVSFTEREEAVLRSVAQGISNKEIARDLQIAESTVKIHVRSICRKLRSRNRTQAALFASTYFQGRGTARPNGAGRSVNLYPVPS